MPRVALQVRPKFDVSDSELQRTLLPSRLYGVQGMFARVLRGVDGSWMLKHSKHSFTVSNCGMNGLATAPSARRHTHHETSRHVCAQHCLAAAGRPPVATCGAMLQRVVLCCNAWCYVATCGAMLQRVVLVATWFDTSAIAAHFTGTFQARYRHVQACYRHVTGTFEALGNASVGTVDLLVVYLHERSMHRVHIRHIHADLEKQSHAAQSQCVFHRHTR